MKQNKYLLNILLALGLTLALGAAMLVKCFQPAAILPALNIPNLTLFSLVFLVLEHFLRGNQKRDYIALFVLSLVSFALLPLAVGMGSVKLALGGSVVFTAVTWLFGAMMDRMESGHNSKLAAIVSALGLYLAVQAFGGILL